MNWSDERYVRIYTRDTPTMIAVGWEGRFVLYELIRKVDRAGVLDIEGDPDLVPDTLRMPADVCRAGLERLISRGVVTMRGKSIVLPNFIDAQETKQSDRARQRESRLRRQEMAMAGGADRLHALAAARPHRYRALLDNGSQNVTHGSQNVFNGSQRVTTGHSVPSRAVPCRIRSKDIVGLAPDEPPPGATQEVPTDAPTSWPDAPTPTVTVAQSDPQTTATPIPQRRVPGLVIRARAEAAAWIEWYNRTFGRQFEVRSANVNAVKRLLADRHSQGAMRIVALYLRRQWADDPRMAKHLVPSTLLKLDRFGERVDAAREADPELARQFALLDAKPLETRLRAALEKTAAGPVASALARSLTDLGTTGGDT